MHTEIPVAHTACHPCLQGYVLASPLDTAVDLVSRNPGQGNRVLAVVLQEALVVTADYMDCPLRMAALSFLPLGPWNQEAGQSRDIININPVGQN